MIWTSLIIFHLSAWNFNHLLHWSTAILYGKFLSDYLYLSQEKKYLKKVNFLSDTITGAKINQSSWNLAERWLFQIFEQSSLSKKKNRSIRTKDIWMKICFLNFRIAFSQRILDLSTLNFNHYYTGWGQYCGKISIWLSSFASKGKNIIWKKRIFFPTR